MKQAGRRRLIIHIGFHKTGSTAIQTGLWSNRTRLLKVGIDYPILGVVGRGHHNIAYGMLGNWRYLRGFGNLRELRGYARRSGASTMILSAEEFDMFERRQIERLSRAFEGWSIIIAAYLRRQDLMLQAVWAQRVRSGILDQSFDDWFDTLFYRADGTQEQTRLLNRLDFEGRISDWAGVFGGEAIRIRPYESGGLQEDILRDFFDLVDLEVPREIRFENRENVTPSFRTLEAIRAFLLSGDGRAAARNRAVYHIYRPPIYSRMVRMAEELGWNNEPLQLVDRDKYDLLMARYDAGNRAIARIYLHREKLFLQPYRDHPIRIAGSVAGGDAAASLNILARELAKRDGAEAALNPWATRLVQTFRARLARRPELLPFLESHYRMRAVLRAISHRLP